MKNELSKSPKWKRLRSDTIVNRFPRADFTTKAGLCKNLQRAHWYHEDGVAQVLYPRSYNVFEEDELSRFVYDFRLTACVNLLKIIRQLDHRQAESRIDFNSIDFACQRCNEYELERQHIDLDWPIPCNQYSVGIFINTNSSTERRWNKFLINYYRIVNEINGTDILSAKPQICEASLCSSCTYQVTCTEWRELQERCDRVLNAFVNYWPQFHLDGVNNLWILKPAAKSQGKGIFISDKLEDILSKVRPNTSRRSVELRYVAQKYIERPLLIYETKFDIRQWFLVTRIFPLTIWMYKESYLRFCSQKFSLINTHESIHLSNNAIQCKYTNGKRDPNLPEENMWDCYTFQTYLRAKGHADAWHTQIYPDMRRSIVCALLASQEAMDYSKENYYELFGADFMVSERLEIYLIEINSGPSMSSSTSVTARMCAQVLDDVNKVVVDRKLDATADTGMFELAYKQQIPAAPPYTGQNLIVRGIKLRATGVATQRYKTDKFRKRNFKFSAIVTTRQSIKKVNAKSPTDSANLAKLPRINIPKIK